MVEKYATGQTMIYHTMDEASWVFAGKSMTVKLGRKLGKVDPRSNKTDLEK